MNVIARPAINAAKERHPNASAWLDHWWRVASKADWRRLADVRVTFPATDEVGQCLIFNACGNDYRLICRFRYATQGARGTLFVKHFLTHVDYDKNKWCKDCKPVLRKKSIPRQARRTIKRAAARKELHLKELRRQRKDQQ